MAPWRLRRARATIARERAAQAAATWEEIEAYTADKLAKVTDQLIAGPAGPSVPWSEYQGEIARIDHELASRWQTLAAYAPTPWAERACLISAVWHVEEARQADLLRGALGRHHTRGGGDL